MSGEYKFLVGGSWRSSGQKVDIRSPYAGEVVGTVFFAQERDVEDAVSSASSGFERTRRLSSFERSDVLDKAASLLAGRKGEFSRAISLENGKPVRDSSAEVERAVSTLQFARDEAKRLSGEVVPVDTAPWTKGKKAILLRVPLGPVAGISPFNFPLNLVCHKIAPAIAAGNSIVLKPSSSTPITALKLAEIFLEAGFPGEALSVVPCSSKFAERLVTDDRIKLLSFTGSPAVGWELKRKAGKKKVLLELGGNAAVIVHEDADVSHAAARCKVGGFSYAGQSCISVQRIYVHEKVFDEFSDRLVQEVGSLVVGDPLDPRTEVGPLIDEDNAKRIERWIGEAVAAGARLLTGGKRTGSLFQPTVLSDAPPKSDICFREAFGPVVVLERYSDFREAVAAVNDSAFGLQAAVFTNDVHRIFYAFRELQVGGVIVNDATSFRVDNMPYGGVKDSGFGREGPRYAIEEMTEPKLLVLHLPLDAA